MAVVSAPVAEQTVIRTMEPSKRAVKDGIVIEHRELISKVYGNPGDWNPSVIQINPGLTDFAEWLSTQASGYRRYELEKLEFIFTTTAPTTTPGKIHMAIVPDPLQGVPDSDDQLSKIVGAIQAPIYTHANCTSSRATLRGRRYLRTNPVSDADLKTYDPGYFVFDTRGMDTTAYVGDIYLNYTVKLFVSDVDSPGIGALYTSQVYDPGAGVDHPIDENVYPFTANFTTITGNPPGYPEFTPGEDPYPYAKQFIMKTGTYLVLWQATGTLMNGVAAGMVVSVPLGYGMTARVNFQGFGGTVTSTWLVDIGVNGTQLDFSFEGGDATSIDSTEVLITDTTMITDEMQIPIASNKSYQRHTRPAPSITRTHHPSTPFKHIMHALQDHSP